MGRGQVMLPISVANLIFDWLPPKEMYSESSETERLPNFIGCHVHYNCDNISETVQDRDVFLVGSSWHRRSNSWNSDEHSPTASLFKWNFSYSRATAVEAVLAIRPGRPWPYSFLAYPNGAGHPHDPHVHHFCWPTQNLLGLWLAYPNENS